MQKSQSVFYIVTYFQVKRPETAHTVRCNTYLDSGTICAIMLLYNTTIDLKLSLISLKCNWTKSGAHRHITSFLQWDTLPVLYCRLFKNIPCLYLTKLLGKFCCMFRVIIDLYYEVNQFCSIQLTPDKKHIHYYISESIHLCLSVDSHQ